MKKITTELFIQRASVTHKGKYNYSMVQYTTARNKIIIGCPEHGYFEQVAHSHAVGMGCNKCGGIKANKKSNGIASKTFIKKANNIHNNAYDYSSFAYINSKVKSIIRCKKHNTTFKQDPNHHLSGAGCPTCGNENKNKPKIVRAKLLFVTESNKQHNNKYDYSKVNYITSKEPVTIICSIHGNFESTPDNHKRGSGCYKCGVNLSKAENSLGQYLEDLGVIVERSDRALIAPYELDLILPEHNIAIEYNGLRWHTEEFGKGRNYHKNKSDACAEKGYRLIHIWEDDYENNKEKILLYLKHLVGKSDAKRVYGRKCNVKVIHRDMGRDFLSKHHIQGAGPSTVYYGTFTNKDDELVAVTSFSKGKSNTKNKNMYELSRHATSCSVIGSLGKSLKQFKTDHNEMKVYTFCDNAFFNGDSYVKAGFVKVGSIPPDYRYVVNGAREHKFLWRKGAIALKLGICGDTEENMMKSVRLYKIWDCGKTRYECG